MNMRKFYVTYRRHIMYDEYEFDSIIVTLNEGEKAHPLTFEKKLNTCGAGGKEVMSWSLIEE